MQSKLKSMTESVYLVFQPFQRHTSMLSQKKTNTKRTGFLSILQISRATSPLPGWGPRLKENRTGIYQDNYGYDPSGDTETGKVYIVDSTMNGDFPEKRPTDYQDFHKL